MSDKRGPTLDEIQKEVEELINQKYGGAVKFFTHIEDGVNKEKSEEGQNVQELIRGFNFTPKELKGYLDRFVIGQDEAKKALATAICDHYNFIKYHGSSKENLDNNLKQNVLLLGPTGVGKTYLVKLLAKLVGVPFVKADATRFTETGYVGANVDDLIRDLVTQAKGDINKAQYGIIYLDEADKLATPPNMIGRDVSGRGVQFGLLKLMEESEVDLRTGFDMLSQMQNFLDFQKKGKVEKKVISTRHILFIVSGAFTGLEEIIRKRLNLRKISLDQESEFLKQEKNILRHITTEDIIQFGFEPEFIGRLPIRVSCDHLEVDDLFQILKTAEASLIKQYEVAFKCYGIDVIFSDEALLAVAEMASKEKTGARGLMTILENKLREFKYELPSTNVREFVITKQIIENPSFELKKLITDSKQRSTLVIREKIRSFEKSFSEQAGVSIRFTEAAMNEVAKRIEINRLPVEAYLESMLTSYEHGLNLVKQNSGKNQFDLDIAVVENPKLALEKMVGASYQANKI